MFNLKRISLAAIMIVTSLSTAVGMAADFRDQELNDLKAEAEAVVGVPIFIPSSRHVDPLGPLKATLRQIILADINLAERGFKSLFVIDNSLTSRVSYSVRDYNAFVHEGATAASIQSTYQTFHMPSIEIEALRAKAKAVTGAEVHFGELRDPNDALTVLRTLILAKQNFLERGYNQIYITDTVTSELALNERERQKNRGHRKVPAASLPVESAKDYSTLFLSLERLKAAMTTKDSCDAILGGLMQLPILP